MQHKCNTKNKKPATRAGCMIKKADRTGLTVSKFCLIVELETPTEA